MLFISKTQFFRLARGITATILIQFTSDFHQNNILMKNSGRIPHKSIKILFINERFFFFCWKFKFYLECLKIPQKIFFSLFPAFFLFCFEDAIKILSE